jgi:DeoR/GlpR family transcriptional regulator of sugar metabolism
VARLLVGRPLHVVTNSLPVANLFASDTRSDLVWIGGNVCPRTGVALGPYADKMLAAIRVRKTVLSVAAVNHEGFFNDDLRLVETERAMMQAADEVIVVADSSKFGHRSLTHLCELGAVNWVVVDGGLIEPWKGALVQAGVRVMVAGEGNEHSPSD